MIRNYLRYLTILTATYLLKWRPKWVGRDSKQSPLCIVLIMEPGQPECVISLTSEKGRKGSLWVNNTFRSFMLNSLASGALMNEQNMRLLLQEKLDTGQV